MAIAASAPTPTAAQTEAAPFCCIGRSDSAEEGRAGATSARSLARHRDDGGASAVVRPSENPPDLVLENATLDCAGVGGAV
jgi:hypothetical protein